MPLKSQKSGLPKSLLVLSDTGQLWRCFFALGEITDSNDTDILRYAQPSLFTVDHNVISKKIITTDYRSTIKIDQPLKVQLQTLG